MPRPSGTQITGELARKLVKKLKGKRSSQPGTSAAHQFYDIFDADGILVSTISVRHSMKKYLGHDHMPEDLHVNAHTAKEMARCNISRDQWLKQMKSRGVI